MNVKIAVKSPATRKVRFDDCELENTPESLRGLITEMVSGQVRDYNARRRTEMDVDPSEKSDILETLRCIDSDAISRLAHEGKVSFGEVYNTKLQDLDKAIEVALQAFEDGMYAVFVNDVELERLDTPIELHDDDRVTLIRLTFLAGRMW